MFDKDEEEVKCDNSGASLVARAEEENARAVQDAISALMKRHGEEMGDATKASSKEARACFTEAFNAAVEEAISKVRSKSELRRRRDVKEAARVVEDDNLRSRAQEEEGNSSSVQISMTGNILDSATKKAKGEIFRAVEETIAYVTVEKDRDMYEGAEHKISESGQGLYRSDSEAKEKFETEAAEGMKMVIKEAVSALR